MTSKRMLLSTVAVDTSIFVIGGLDERVEALQSAEKFDVVSGTWSSIPDMTSKRAFFSTVAVDKSIFVIGGGQEFGDAEAHAERFHTGISNPSLGGYGPADAHLAPSSSHGFEALFETQIEILPWTPWESCVNSRTLLQELQENELIRSAVPQIDRIAGDIEVKTAEIMHAPGTSERARTMGSDKVGAILGYSHDLQNGVKDGQLYFEWNKGIKIRDPVLRVEMIKRWGVVTRIALEGFGDLPDFAGTAYRGLPDRTPITSEYVIGRPIQWGSFTSVATGATALQTARGFSDQGAGIILKITVVSGRQLGRFSFFPTEGEVVLSPMSKFIVSSAPYTGDDGWMYLDLVQMDLR
eukprot:TRINITY_DN8595_c0_g1_i4.p1 TRINITY_DN8595_c0_g1~~TRINITY_DN8595_c0_g1_i4.p1  ORF type:complete len:353 (+),score=37.80 TRINITY_DN8595_c0_g1_i4:338-1396(+)